MQKQIEAQLKKYFPQKWSQSDIEKWTGRASFKTDVSAVNKSLNDPIKDFIFRGGKRLRPILCLTLLKSFGENPRQYIDIATITELVHNGTLIIDDVEDSAELRRGKPALHKTFGIDTALNAGSTLIVLPAKIINQNKHTTEAQKLQLFTIYAEEVTNVHFGQAIDIEWHKSTPKQITPAKYFETTRLKTGALMRMSTRFACVLGDQNRATTTALTRFAEAIGIAFQIKDDTLDLTSTEKTFGKAFGNDITEGKVSLPVILALQILNSKDQKRLKEILQLHTKNKKIIKEAQTLIKNTDAIDRSLTQASKLLEKALKNAKNHIPNSKDQATLEKFVSSLIQRDH